MLAMQKNPSIKAMIVGSAGQDGYYLGRSLLRDGVEIVGITRSGVLLPCETKIRPFCLLDSDSVSSLIKEVKPEQIYYLPAYHQSSETKLENTNVLLMLNLPKLFKFIQKHKSNYLEILLEIY